MRVKYRYKEYESFPEATEISKDRERRKSSLVFLLPLEIIFTTCMIVTTIMSPYFLLIVISIIMILSIFHTIYVLKHYDERTEEKIAKAINDSKTEKREMAEYLANSKYSCKSIVHKNEFKKGKCHICYKVYENLEKCKIKNDVGTREIFICEECIANYEANFKCE